MALSQSAADRRLAEWGYDVFVMRLDSAAIVIVEIQLWPIGDMGDQLAIRLRSMRSSSSLFAL